MQANCAGEKISSKFEIFYHFKTGFGIIRRSKNQAFHAFKLIDFNFHIHTILMFVFGLAKEVDLRIYFLLNQQILLCLHSLLA